ncbi:DEKNAAC105502 [Brettanomyces naardenensis]|uniref:DEKNAAC105502 n=1 Tax=Brettanomyces naardenensis TaxID=13370 RepID=A0A448YU11_BRENA|nr:DEKNAAC105502 [Brettanomyces naardenensis]
MSEHALQEQFQQARQTKKDNAQLTTRYKKYLSRTLATLSTPTKTVSPGGGTIIQSSGNGVSITTESLSSQPSSRKSQALETPLSAKVEVIYENQRQILRQKEIIKADMKQVEAMSKELKLRIEKTRRKLQDNHLVRFVGDEGGKEEIKDLVQRKSEVIDQQIRILENCMKMVETNQSVPAVTVKRGLFG